jgi:hypothetical protein
VNELGLQLLEAGLGLLMFGEIADESGEIGYPTGLHFANRKMHRERGAVLALARDNSANADNVPLAAG